MRDIKQKNAIRKQKAKARKGRSGKFIPQAFNGTASEICDIASEKILLTKFDKNEKMNQNICANQYKYNDEPDVDHDDDDNDEVANDETDAAKQRLLTAPWATTAEFVQVYECLYGGTANDETRGQAVQRIRGWARHNDDVCPATVLATSVLVEVRLSEATERPEILQALYATAFTRFFNYVSSIVRPHKLCSMYETAEQQQLWSFVVDLRHICTHGLDFPPLQTLRQVVGYCLDWLRGYYWQPQLQLLREFVPAEVRSGDDDNEIGVLFQLYDTTLKAYLLGGQQLRACKRHIHGKRFDQLKTFFVTHELATLSDALNLIAKQLAEQKPKSQTSLTSASYVDAFVRMDYFFVGIHKHKLGAKADLLRQAVQSLFRMFAAVGYIEHVFESLLALANNTAVVETRRRGATFWAVQLLKGYSAMNKFKLKIYELKPIGKVPDTSMINITPMPAAMRKLLLNISISSKKTLTFSDTADAPRSYWHVPRRLLANYVPTLNEHTLPIVKRMMPLLEPTLAEHELVAYNELIDAHLNLHQGTKLSVATDVDSAANKTIFSFEDFLTLMKAERNYEISKPSSEHVRYWGSVPKDYDTYTAIRCPLAGLPWE